MFDHHTSKWMLSFLVGYAGVLGSLPTHSMVPPTTTIQGSLDAEEGGPLIGTFPYQVEFFDRSTGGSWLGEVTGELSVSGQGRFNIEIPLPALGLQAPELWYELAIDRDLEGIDEADVFPHRVKVTSVPFALVAADSQGLGGIPADSYATDEEVSVAVEAGPEGGLTFRPWWGWWWWALPWRLGIDYQRVVPVNSASNLSCRDTLVVLLQQDAAAYIFDATELNLTIQALDYGRYGGIYSPTNNEPLALVVVIERCEFLSNVEAVAHYKIYSNKGPTDPDPRTMAPPSATPYPWTPGQCCHLKGLGPESFNPNLREYLNSRLRDLWVASTGINPNDAASALVYLIADECEWQ